MVLTQAEYEKLCPNLCLGPVVGDIPGQSISPAAPEDPELTSVNVGAAFALFGGLEQFGYRGIATQVGLTKAQIITLYEEYRAAIIAKAEQEYE